MHDGNSESDALRVLHVLRKDRIVVLDSSTARC
jgi:hypothetical protein